MKKLIFASLLTACVCTAPAQARHAFSTDTPFATRGMCEAEVARLISGDLDFLLDSPAMLFSNKGEAASFLTRAFPCEKNPEDQRWYIVDRRLEVIGSEWFQRRL